MYFCFLASRQTMCRETIVRSGHIYIYIRIDIQTFVDKTFALPKNISNDVLSIFLQF